MHLDYLKAFVDRMSISIQQIRQPITVNSTKGSISNNYVYPSCVVCLADEDFVANLVVIPLDVFDAILGIDWLSQYQAIILCFMKIISLHAPSGRDKYRLRPRILYDHKVDLIFEIQQCIELH
jgi:hypothetical protein